jgi:hypothetical protein
MGKFNNKCPISQHKEGSIRVTTQTQRPRNVPSAVARLRQTTQLPGKIGIKEFFRVSEQVADNIGSATNGI